MDARLSFMRQFKKRLRKELLEEQGADLKSCDFGVSPRGITVTVTGYTPSNGITWMVWLVVDRKTFKVLWRKGEQIVP